jgi:hypothetical protein
VVGSSELSVGDEVRLEDNEVFFIAKHVSLGVAPKRERQPAAAKKGEESPSVVVAAPKKGRGRQAATAAKNEEDSKVVVDEKEDSEEEMATSKVLPKRGRQAAAAAAKKVVVSVLLFILAMQGKASGAVYQNNTGDHSVMPQVSGNVTNVFRDKIQTHKTAKLTPHLLLNSP